MKKIYSVINLIKTKKLSVAITNKCLSLNLLNWVPDKLYLKIRYKQFLGENLDLKDPKTFNEKLQWLKINDRNPKYVTYVDKYAVRDHIKNIIGEHYLIPLIDVFDSVEEIKWDTLPEQFVLKCTHGSGCNIICKNKRELDITDAKDKLNKWMNTNYFWHGREWPYKNVKPKITCEIFLEDEIFDYKFYCFNGKPEFIYIAQGDNTNGSLKMTFLDLNWKECDFYRKDHEKILNIPSRPVNFEEMKAIVRKLCEEFKFVRVDLFCVNNKIYFGELTMSPGNGFTPFSPKKYELDFGELINI